MNEKTFKSVKQSRISQQVADQIKNLILEGNLKPGDKLPNERDLSRTIGVGRLSLREGLRILETMGILETRYGVKSGTYVSLINTRSLVERFSDILKLSDLTIDQLTQGRLEISLINLRYFIKSAKSEDIEELEKCIKETEEMLKVGLRTREKNIFFHQLIAQGSKNPILVFLHESLLEILRHFLSKFDSPPDHSKKVLEGNKNILKGIKERDYAKAAEAMKRHLEYIDERMREIFKNTNSLNLSG